MFMIKMEEAFQERLNRLEKKCSINFDEDPSF